MSAPAITVLGARATRLAGTVHLQVDAVEGRGVLRFTPADAQRYGHELVAAATAEPENASPVSPARPPTLPHIVAAARGLPLLKPSGAL